MSENSNAEEFNADELEPPQWLNATYLETILITYESAPELKVTDLKISPASAQGDHYASVMFRTTVEYTTGKGTFNKPLIVKTMPEQDGHKKDMLSDSHLFDTEIGMYSKVLPEFERILKQAGDDTKLYAACIFHSMEPRQVMIFEDLVPQGYIVVRGRSVREEELCASLSKLAKWNAVSMKFNNENPDFIKEFKYGLFDLPTLMSDPMVTTGMGNFIAMLDQVPDLKKYKPHFEKIKDNYLDRTRAVMTEYRTDPKSDEPYVLAHGDFHLRNMMFRHNKETGAFEDVMLVDFQICNLAPISVDLIYSIYMLMEPEQRWNHGEKLINFYITILVDTLKKIGYKGTMPTQEKIWQQIHRHKIYEFFLITTFLPMILAVKSNTLKIVDMIQDPITRQKTYLMDSYVEEARKLLPMFEKMGYFKDL
ncbi:uncharacterized protein LOC117585912 isoform X1 [Drosophila guanche]|uniref:CHK kinase-like domain-containing protein n=1 Tax=Drosophila guanche TaxID=7266 RepID=A0A3B0K8A7_DROGU|nr:uncharacterized protein LOC117585912 isoform X1 [Drosophila guanche]SPP84320.1 Hypothetical predicted protein [Drosophila guanche]